VIKVFSKKKKKFIVMGASGLEDNNDGKKIKLNKVSQLRRIPASIPKISIFF
jgi:hypothetical protein